MPSAKAQPAGGFKVCPIGWAAEQIYDRLSAPDQPVWRLVLIDDRRTPVPQQVVVRIDWSVLSFHQTNRVRQTVGFLAAGQRGCDLACEFGITRPGITQRMARLLED